ncbi:MAG: hypothetical protein US42_C0014G0054 [Candidatus Magasanikbacteria bacterium GW2011_GWC2_37_14]|uniref:Uncharacterized protein n=1 Tax=Candidatus Magasanikbacteria bacterium GW2011_GWC2_37_14 TaxID=1619046 RepID=A0A0G0GB36_9BACT|nr:MAG: hypothetical protein US42_C0014G0054 [Candidatus Magasanikbacteria bacterium GW2011_GWC2_37_14]
MQIKNLISKKSIFIALFVLTGFGLMQIPFTNIIGSNTKFSLFDFYGPIAGAFVGSIWGLVTVGVMQLINWAWQGFNTDLSVIIRLFPVLFSALYFARKSKLILLVPAICMIAFWAHPEGRIAWVYALYWLVPIIAYFFYEKSILLRALGTTFTAHAVGGVLFLYILGLKSYVWIGLIPIVWKERGLMAIGITVTFIGFNYLFSLLNKKFHITLPFVKLNPKYSVK